MIRGSTHQGEEIITNMCVSNTEPQLREKLAMKVTNR